MTFPDIEMLNRKFSLRAEKNKLSFKLGKGDIPLVEIENEQASVVISLQGAHLLSWIPKGEEDVIWLSSDARFEKGKSVRGGIPICWPWFGAHESNSDFPAHGFARTVIWSVCAVKQLDSGETQIHFNFNTPNVDSTVAKMWPINMFVEYIVTIGTSLSLELITHNKGAASCVIGEALHTYFNVGDVKQTSVQGLHEIEYLDKPDGFKRKTQKADIEITGEVDRVYINAAPVVTIINQHRKIIISTQGSQSTIVWNPGKVVADKMADLGENGYLKMLCVESANAADNVVTIAAGKSHTLQAIYKLEKI